MCCAGSNNNFFLSRDGFWAVLGVGGKLFGQGKLGFGGLTLYGRGDMTMGVILTVTPVTFFPFKTNLVTVLPVKRWKFDLRLSGS